MRKLQQRAYEIYVHSGFRPGQCEQNWIQAERELLQRYLAQLDGHQRRSSSPEAKPDSGSEEPQDLGSSHLHLSYAEPEPANVA